METKAGFIKNIILVVASALTLVAVTFAWFSTAGPNMIYSFNEKISAVGNLETVRFLEETADGYAPFGGDISLENVIPGYYKKYKISIKPQADIKTKLSLRVRDLPTDFSNNLDDYVNIKYVLVENDVDSPESGNIISQSTNYIKISSLKDNPVIFESDLSQKQASGIDKFTVFYEIGLSESASQAVSGLESDLGRLEVVAVEVD